MITTCNDIVQIAPGCYCSKDKLDETLKELKEEFGEGPYGTYQVMYLELKKVIPDSEGTFEDFCKLAVGEKG